jgi:chitin synthase
VTVAYIVYLIVEVALRTTIIPLTAFILLGAIYGLQAIIFILRRKWEMIGWMILYVCAIPVFSFALPLYSFWHMDDFSWGNTRVVTGEKGRKIVITDEGKFDPASIPHKKWEDYQAELWDAQTQRDDRSEVSGYSYGTKSYHVAQSEHNYPPSRPMSQMGYPYGNQPAPAYSSRLSLVHSELGMPRYSGQYGSQIYSNQEVELANLSGLPSDDAILAEIREILRTADLMTVTKKSIKLELEKRFGVGLDAKRPYINSGMLFLRSHGRVN